MGAELTGAHLYFLLWAFLATGTPLIGCHLSRCWEGSDWGRFIVAYFGPPVREKPPTFLAGWYSPLRLSLQHLLEVGVLDFEQHLPACLHHLPRFGIPPFDPRIPEPLVHGAVCPSQR